MKINEQPGKFTTPAEVRLVRTLPGPIERVWEYLTDPEKRARKPAGALFGIGEIFPHAFDRSGQRAHETHFSRRGKLSGLFVDFHEEEFSGFRSGGFRFLRGGVEFVVFLLE